MEITVGSEWVCVNPCVDELEVLETSTDEVVYQVIGGSVYVIDRVDFLKEFKPKEQGRKDDSAKLRYSLLPSGTVNQVVQVLEFGSNKYADNNWQKVENSRTRYYDAAMRHIDAWFNGDLKDAETGLHHLAHAICCLMFLMWFDGE